MTNPAIRWHAFLADLRREVAAARASGATLALLLVEVREFHGLNLRHGFNDVEGVMRQILSRLAEPLKKATAINRTGPNRLALILPELAGPELLPVAAQKLFTQLAAPYPVGGGGAGNQPGHGPRPLSRPRQQRRGTARRGGARPGHRPGHGHSLRHPPQGRG